MVTVSVHLSVMQQRRAKPKSENSVKIALEMDKVANAGV